MAESKAISSDTLVQVQQGFVYNPHRRYSAFGYLSPAEFREEVARAEYVA
jgi:hypothetical protein